ncbi:MAG: hypothetical protein K2Y05_04380, partial [Hyphomicrobiaceae bacterium]|nr:hypothetical protein [Hyphomicrobiaceae bacterium]
MARRDDGVLTVWWKRKNDGFVWREHVRTTILVRRDQRRQQIEDIRVAAVDGVKDVGRQSAELGAAGARHLATGLWRALSFIVLGAIDVVFAVASATSLWLWHTAGPAFATVGAMLSRAARPLVAILRQPIATLVLGLAGLAASMSAVARYWQAGADHQAVIAITAAVSAFVLLLVAQWPKLCAAAGLDKLELSNGGRRAMLIGAGVSGTAALVAVVVAAGGFTGAWRTVADSATAVVSDPPRPSVETRP